jgi:hypothetical protein
MAYPTDEQIREHGIWEKLGRLEGRAEEFCHLAGTGSSERGSHLYAPGI